MSRTAWAVYRAALQERADLYHIHDPELLPVAQLLRMVTRKPVIFDMHENLPKAIVRKPWISAGLRPCVAGGFKLLERLLLKGLSVIFAERSYATDYPWIRNASFVLNMPIVEQFRGAPARAQESRNAAIGYIGGVSEDRGSLATVEALKILKERGVHLRWECVGPIGDDHRAELERRIALYGLTGVTLYGYLVASEGWKILERCVIGLALLRPVPNYIDSYPTKMFEYMASGMPVVVSDFPLYRAVVQDSQCGLCVDPENPIAVAAAMQWLLEHPVEAQAMGRRGQEAVQSRYNWHHEAINLTRLYATLLGV